MLKVSRSQRAALTIFLTVFTWSLASSSFASGLTSLLSINSLGEPGNGHSRSWGTTPLSSDGRYIAFQSDATNMGWLSTDTNGKLDVFVRDRETKITVRVSVSSSEEQANGTSSKPAISGDGRYVAFLSSASNLVSGDTNEITDVFVRDIVLGTTKRVSVSSSEQQANAEGDTNIYDGPAISGDGRYIAFASTSSNLVANDTNESRDVFVRDTKEGTTKRVSVSNSGTQKQFGNDEAITYPSISADGRYVVFKSKAQDLVSNDSNGTEDVFVRDTQANTTTRVSVSNSGQQANNKSPYPAKISPDGRYVAFASEASNLVSGDSNNKQDVFIRDIVLNTTKRISVSTAGAEGNHDSHADFSISSGGRHIAFTSDASTLVADDTNDVSDVFLRDTQLNTTKRISVSTWGKQATDHSFSPAISWGGRYVAFNSNDDGNLVGSDQGNITDIFLRDTQWLVIG